MSAKFELLKSAIENLITFFKTREARFIKINIDLETQIKASGSDKDILIDALRQESEGKTVVIDRLSADLAQSQAATVAAMADDVASAESQQIAAIALSESNAQVARLKAQQLALEAKVAESEVAIAQSAEATARAQEAADAARLELASEDGNLDALIQLTQSATTEESAEIDPAPVVIEPVPEG
jgi:hypothetical protein